MNKKRGNVFVVAERKVYSPSVFFNMLRLQHFDNFSALKYSIPLIQLVQYCKYSNHITRIAIVLGIISFMVMETNRALPWDALGNPFFQAKCGLDRLCVEIKFNFTFVIQEPMRDILTIRIIATRTLSFVDNEDE